LKSSSGYASVAVQKKKRIVGLVAIAFLLVFTVLAVLGFLSSWEWLIADAVVFVAANLILRNIGKPRL
jgi:CHASE2 domain-containing sensor protein